MTVNLDIQRRWNDGVLRIGAPLVLVVVLLTFWQVAASGDQGLGDVIGSPIGVANALVSYGSDGSLAGDLQTSLAEAGLGWLVAVLVGVPLGLMAGRVAVVRAIVVPIVELLRPVSPIAWTGPLILWFGVGMTSKAVLIVIFCVFTIFVGTFDAARRTDPALLAAARMLGSKKSALAYRVVLPAAVPSVASASRFAVTAAWGGTLVAEMTGATSGVGYRMFSEAAVGNAEAVIAVMVVVGVVGFVLDTGFKWLSNRGLRRYA